MSSNAMPNKMGTVERHKLHLLIELQADVPPAPVVCCCCSCATMKVRMSGSRVLEVLVAPWTTWHLGIRLNTVSSIALQLHVLVEEGVRRARVEHEEVEHPHTLAVGNHVEDVARAEPQRGDARDTGML